MSAAAILPRTALPGSWAPPNNDAGHLQWGSGLGASGPVAKDRFGGRDLTLEEQQMLFFGPPLKDVRQDPYASQSIENYILPDAWKGQNNYIRQIIFNEITGDKAIWTSELLPWKEYKGGNTVCINRLIFDQHLLDMIPEQGVARLVTTHHDTQVQNLERRGLAFMMENGFAMTQQGKEQYLYSIMQIRMATVETFCFLAAVAILNAPPRPANLLLAYHAPIAFPSFMRVLDYESYTWGILTSAQHGFEKMQDYGRKALAQNGVTPDVLILPEGTPEAYKYCHPEETEFAKAGPMGPAYMASDGGPLMAKAKMKVVLSRSFGRGDDVTRDPFVRERSKGTFFQMAHEFLPLLPPGKAYPADCRNTGVLDGKYDVVKPLSYWEALDNSLLATGGVTHPAKTLLRAVLNSDSLTQRWAIRCQDVNNPTEFGVGAFEALNPATAANAIQDGLDTAYLGQALKHLGRGTAAVNHLVMAAAAIPLSPFPSTQTLRDFAIRYGVPLPFNLLLLRPHEMWEMGSAVMMKKGAETGSTYLGFNDFELSRDGNRKMLLGFYTVYGNPIIENPQNIHVLHNVIPINYVRGESTKFFHPTSDVEGYKNGWKQETQVKDIFVVPIETPLMRDNIDITGQYPSEVEDDPDSLHYLSALAAAAIFGWQTPDLYMDSMSAFNDDRIYNTRCWQGTQYFWGLNESGTVPHSMALRKTGSKCQFGPSIYAGVMRDRLGRGRSGGIIPLNELHDGAREVVAAA